MITYDFTGKVAFVTGAAIPAFLDWLEQLDCGVDLLGSADYRLPRRTLAS